jgi:hypothetical protein
MPNNTWDQAASGDSARLSVLVGAKEDDTKSPENRPIDADEEKQQFLDVRKLRNQFIDYLTSKVDEIEDQKEARRYYHGAQYSPEQINILRRRRQPPLTWNRVNRKINGIMGVVERLRSDPKALPRHIRSEQGANIATQVIRYVLEANDFKGIDPWCLMQACIDGIAGVQLVLTKDDEGQMDIALTWVIGDEFFYDPKSYRADFSDARWKGISKWFDIEEAIELFPDKEDELRGLIEGDSDLTTNADREYKWIIASTQRVRIIEHWYKHRGKWCWAFYVSTVILDQGVSPFFDERGKSVDSFKMFSVAVDHDGDRYGFVRNLKGPQDSLNQSKSKQLHVANSRRVVADKGAVDDVEKARIEYARPDGWVETNPGRAIKPDDKPQDIAAFGDMAANAANEIDQFASINMAVLSGAMLTNISGRAIELLRQPGMAELGPFILAYRQWKLAVYRSIWCAAQRHWTSPKWLRIIDDESQKPVFMQLNALSLDNFGRPVIVNALGSLDVDIIMEEGPDVASLTQDVYDMLKGYPPGTFPPAVLIELSPLPRVEKARIMKMMQPPPPNPQAIAAQQAAAKLQMEGAAIRNAKTAADARKSDAQAQKASVEAGTLATSSQIEMGEAQHRILTELLQLAQPPQPAQSRQPQQPRPPAPMPIVGP